MDGKDGDGLKLGKVLIVSQQKWPKKNMVSAPLRHLMDNWLAVQIDDFRSELI